MILHTLPEEMISTPYQLETAEKLSNINNLLGGELKQQLCNLVGT